MLLLDFIPNILSNILTFRIHLPITHTVTWYIKHPKTTVVCSIEPICISLSCNTRLWPLPLTRSPEILRLIWASCLVIVISRFKEWMVTVITSIYLYLLLPIFELVIITLNIWIRWFFMVGWNLLLITIHHTLILVLSIEFITISWWRWSWFPKWLYVIWLYLTLLFRVG